MHHLSVAKTSDISLLLTLNIATNIWFIPCIGNYIHIRMWNAITHLHPTAYPRKYAHGFVVLCFVVVMKSFIMNSHEVFIHIHQGCFAGTGAIVRLPQCQWSKPAGYVKINQCITTTKHSKTNTVCIFLGIYCSWTVVDVRTSMAKYITCKSIEVIDYPCPKSNHIDGFKQLLTRGKTGIALT